MVQPTSILTSWRNIKNVNMHFNHLQICFHTFPIKFLQNLVFLVFRWGNWGQNIRWHARSMPSKSLGELGWGLLTLLPDFVSSDGQLQNLSAASCWNGSVWLFYLTDWMGGPQSINALKQCGGQNNDPQRGPKPNPQNLGICWICYLTWQKDRADRHKLGSWDGEYSPTDTERTAVQFWH